MRLALALALVALSATGVCAQDQTQEARRLFTEGRRYASEERWVEALGAFEQSLERMERPATLFNIAAVLIRLGRAREAIATIDRFMETSDEARDARMRADARALRAAAEESLRRVTLRVRPPDALVEVDGQLVEGSGAERSLVLDPGNHSVAVTREGYEAARFTLEASVDTREVSLAPLDGTLVVEPTVETARVALDGVEIGSGAVTVPVAPGEHEVTIRADGYLEMRRTVHVEPGARLSVEAALEPVTGGDVLESPLFWGLTAGGVAVVVTVVIIVAVLTAGTEAPYGGSTNVVLAPLVRF